MISIVLDLVVLGVLVLFAVLGWHKGLILSLCGLIAFFVAFAGASFVSNEFGDSISGVIQPYIQSRVEQVLEDSLQTDDTQDTSDTPATYTPTVPGSVPEQSNPTDQFTLEQALEALAQSPLFSGLHQALEDAVQNSVIQIVTTASAAIAGYLAGQIAKTGLFLVTFFLILLVWWLLSHALDLACRLPVLHTLNGAGGLVIGLLKGLILVLVVAWLLSLLDVLPRDAVEQTFLLRRFMNFQILS